MKIVGLDLSLTGTGICVIEMNDIINTELPGLKVSRKDRPEVKMRLGVIKTVPKDFSNLFQRIEHIIKEIETFAHIKEKGSEEPVVWVIEDYFVGQNKKTALSLTELGASVRYWLHINNREFISPAASQIKKFATGKGVGDKGLVMMKIFKDWGVETTENNSADACVAANIGLTMIEEGNNIKNNPKEIKTLTKPRIEVIKAMFTKFDNAQNLKLKIFK